MDPEQQWSDLPIVVIDTETTGTDESADVCEVAAVRFERGLEVARYSSLVRPTCEIPPEASAVHGITNAMVESAPALADLCGELFRICRDAAPCAYNAPFDRKRLHRHIAGIECPAFDPSWSWIDVYVIVASPRVDKFVRGSGRLKLGATCARWGVPLETAHRAAGDAAATGRLLFALYAAGKVKACSLSVLLAHTDIMRAEHERDHAAYRARLASQKPVQTELPLEVARVR